MQNWVKSDLVFDEQLTYFSVDKYKAKRFGIDEAMAANYHCDEVGTALNYEVINEAITSVRACAAPLSADWKKKIDADYKKRGGRR